MQLDEQRVDTWPELFTGGTGEERGCRRSELLVMNRMFLETSAEVTETWRVSSNTVKQTGPHSASGNILI